MRKLRAFTSKVAKPPKKNAHTKISDTNDYENDYFTIVDDSNFRNAIATLFSYEPDVIGLCCGSNPKHITELKNIQNTKNQI